MKREGFAPVLILLIAAIVVAAGGIWYFEARKTPPLQTPTPDQTSASAVMTSTPTTSMGPALSPPLSGLSQTLKGYPDYPLATIPTQPISATFLVQHRTALNGHTVTVKAIVVATSPGITPAPGMGIPSRLPSITLADSTNSGRDKNYDVVVDLSPQSQPDYQMGQMVQIRASVQVASGVILVSETNSGDCGPSTNCNQDELSKEGRDSRRVADLSTLKTAILLYLAAATTPVLCPNQNTIYRSDEGTDAVDGTGWLPINFFAVHGGSPLGKLPTDPINSDGFVYLYACSPASLTFKLAAKMESVKFGLDKSSEIVTTDKGTDPNLYEVGTDLNLNI